MYFDKKIFIGKAENEKVFLYPSKANRHGLIAGATGTGKTITLKVLAESFSDCGVPVFLADIKGDLAGMCKPGEDNENLRGRIEKFKLDECGFNYQAYPTEFWDIYEKNGMPLRTTISEMGPLILSQVLGLNEVQEDILTVVFKIADDQELLLIDTKDLKAILQYVGENAEEFSNEYGNLPKKSLNAIIRSVVALEAEGGDQFFGEPAINILDWFTRDCDGKGTIQILDCQKLIHNPTMYASFMLWLVSELFESLPEAGDLDKPKMVFFFDEAHLLFDHASKPLLDKIEQVVKLIRSKGVGIYFITQNPKDIPDGVLSQLGNKIQHALYAYTPAEQKAAKAASDSFRENPNFDTFEALISLGTGEALVSVLDEKGIPTIVQKTKILPPQSLMGAINDSIREQNIKNSLLYARYLNDIDRDSAYEFLKRHHLEEQEIEKTQANAKTEEKRLKAEAKKTSAQHKKVTRATKSVASTTAGTIGREIGQTFGKAVGGKFGKKLGGNIGASLGRGIIGTLFKL